MAVFTTNFVRSETCTLIGIRLSWPIAGQWLEAFDITRERVTPEDEEHAVHILLRHVDCSACE